MGGRTVRFANRAVKIRFARYGCTNRPFYHLVAARTYRAGNKPPLDRIGSFDPLPNEHNEKLVAINFEKLHYWLKRGAKPTKPVEILLGLAGFFPVHPMCYIKGKRAQKQQMLAAEETEEGTPV
ncbi:small ribosomal subunit protein bS16m-like [Watersipora subatra]|uniref:small ribosomal subunit protein bS16m-like n=1 Tax=Watersipora subatra TaxID=2589382 RepID=UPI00355B9DA9